MNNAYFLSYIKFQYYSFMCNRNTFTAIILRQIINNSCVLIRTISWKCLTLPGDDRIKNSNQLCIDFETWHATSILPFTTYKLLNCIQHFKMLDYLIIYKKEKFSALSILSYIFSSCFILIYLYYILILFLFNVSCLIQIIWI